MPQGSDSLLSEAAKLIPGASTALSVASKAIDIGTKVFEAIQEAKARKDIINASKRLRRAARRGDVDTLRRASAEWDARLAVLMMKCEK